MGLFLYYPFPYSEIFSFLFTSSRSSLLVSILPVKTCIQERFKCKLFTSVETEGTELFFTRMSSLSTCKGIPDLRK